ncbi:Lipoyl synthase [Macleaya cordata]|uniref:Lipoyl synthase n=1 Tax=Macleaya cordata TaxID=56857 RepID=A0A200QK40_MACCD|nr:Lipoyl synthase [Macleaya cordata]
MTTTASLSISSSSFSSVSIKNYSHRQQCIASINSVVSASSLRPRRQQRIISCEVALKPDSAPSISSSAVLEAKEDEDESIQAKIGARVRVKIPLKVYHVPKVPEVDLTGMEGKVKQYVGLWKGKHISANLPFKIEFVKDIEGRGPVKFVAHLKEDEFEYLDDVDERER